MIAAASKAGGRAQHRTDIVRVGDLVEDDERPRASRVDLVLEEVAEVDFLERIDLDHEALVRGIARDESRQVGDVGVADRNHRRQVELAQRFARAPDAFYGALGVGERGENGVASPETDGLAALARALRAAVTGKLSHGRAFPMTAIDRQVSFRHWASSQSGPQWTGGRVVKGSRL